MLLPVGSVICAKSRRYARDIASTSFAIFAMRRKKDKPSILEDGEFLPEQIREVERRVADACSPVRYVVFSDIGGIGRLRLWLDVSGDGYGMSIDQATLFKRKHVARAVARAYSEGRRSELLIAKITTKKGKRRVLRYEKPELQTARCKRRRPPPWSRGSRDR